LAFQSGVDVRFGLGGRDVADGLAQTAVVEPIDPLERGVFDSLEASPGSTSVDDLDLEEAVDRFGQGGVVAVADAAGSYPPARMRPTTGTALAIRS
jgi:hypothetical protein